jgi:catalase (peroxidase I)
LLQLVDSGSSSLMKASFSVAVAADENLKWTVTHGQAHRRPRTCHSTLKLTYTQTYAHLHTHSLTRTHYHTWTHTHTLTHAYTPRPQEEKISEAERDVEDGEARVQSTKVEYEGIVARMTEELNRFQKERASDMSALLRDFALAQAQVSGCSCGQKGVGPTVGVGVYPYVHILVCVAYFAYVCGYTVQESMSTPIISVL